MSFALLLDAGLIDEDRLIVDRLSGTAGAGADLSRAVQHPEIGSNVVLYNVVGHRHTFEMQQELDRVPAKIFVFISRPVTFRSFVGL